jgi:imidazolonepropionase-like amidohydrolase
MRLIKSQTLFDGRGEHREAFFGFEGDEITYIGIYKQDVEIIAEVTVTPTFIDAHFHIGMVRAGEPDREEEANEHMSTVYPLVNALYSIYMDDPRKD